MAGLAMFGIALAALFPKSRKAKPAKPIGTGLKAMLAQVRMFQSGRVGDYVAWFAFGIAAYGGLLFLMR